EHAVGIAALVHSLVSLLADRHDAGERLPVHERDRIAQACWLAARDGLDAALPDLESGRPIPARERISALLDELDPVAAAIGCRGELEACGDLLDANGAERQRAVVAREGIDGLMAWLADETEAPAGVPQPEAGAGSAGIGG